MCGMADELLRISIRNMPRDLWRRVRSLAVRRGVAVHLIIVEALFCYLELVERGKEGTLERYLAKEKK